MAQGRKPSRAPGGSRGYRPYRRQSRDDRHLILRVLVRITDRLGGNFLAFLLLQDLAWETSVGTQLRVHLRIKDLGHFRRFRGFLP